MVERIFILFGLALLIAAGWALIRLWSAWKLRRLRASAPLADLAPAGRPAVIAFSTPSCAECRTRQAPALLRLAAALGDQVTVRSLSALEHPDLISFVSLDARNVVEFTSNRSTLCVIPLQAVSSSRRRSTLPRIPLALSAMVTRIPPMSRSSFTVPRCVWPRRAP